MANWIFPEAVRREADLDGRERELDNIVQVWSSGARRPVLIYGERRIGKTSLKNVVIEGLQTRIASKIVHIQPSTVYDPSKQQSAVEQLAQEVLQELCASQGTSLSARGLQKSAWGEFFQEAERLLCASPASLHVVFIDDFDAVLERCLRGDTPTSRKAAQAVIGFVGDLITRGNLPLTCCFMMTGPPDDLRDDFHSLVEEHAAIIRLRPLSEDKTTAMLTRLLSNQIICEPAQQLELYRLSGGHPYFLKLLLSKLPEPLPLRIDPSTLEQAVNDATKDENANMTLEHLLGKHFSPEEAGLVTLLAARNGGITEDQLERLDGQWRLAARVLVQRGYLDDVSADGVYTLRISFLGHWLRQHPSFRARVSQLDKVSEYLEAELEISDYSTQAWMYGEEVKLRPQEYAVLHYLGKHLGKRVRLRELRENCWESDRSPVTVNVTLGRLLAALKETLSKARRGNESDLSRYLERGRGVYILHRAVFREENRS